MAWRCSAPTNALLISNLFNAGIIKSETVACAMKAVDRACFVRWESQSEAYVDSPAPIGHGATISAPHMHAYALTHLLPFLSPGSHVLDVGSGSGYLTAVLHSLVAPGGKVVGIEHIPELAAWSVQNLKKAGFGEALERGEIEIVVGDGRQGYSARAPYAAIHVGAAAPKLPQALVDQLEKPGRMFIPVGEGAQEILLVEKGEDGEVEKKRLMGVLYVPLTDPETQLGR